MPLRPMADNDGVATGPTGLMVNEAGSDCCCDCSYTFTVETYVIHDSAVRHLKARIKVTGNLALGPGCIDSFWVDRCNRQIYAATSSTYTVSVTFSIIDPDFQWPTDILEEDIWIRPWVNGAISNFDGPISEITNGSTTQGPFTVEEEITLAAGDRLQFQLGIDSTPAGWHDLLPLLYLGYFTPNNKITGCILHDHQETLIPLSLCPDLTVGPLWVGGDEWSSLDNLELFRLAAYWSSMPLKHLPTGDCYALVLPPSSFVSDGSEDNSWVDMQGISGVACDCDGPPIVFPPGGGEVYVPAVHCYGGLTGTHKPLTEVISSPYRIWKIKGQCVYFDLDAPTRSPIALAVGGTVFEDCEDCVNDVPPTDPPPVVPPPPGGGGGGPPPGGGSGGPPPIPWPPISFPPLPWPPPPSNPPSQTCNRLFTCTGTIPTDEYVPKSLGLAGKIIMLPWGCFRVHVVDGDAVPTITVVEPWQIFSTCSGCQHNGEGFQLKKCGETDPANLYITFFQYLQMGTKTVLRHTDNSCYTVITTTRVTIDEDTPMADIVALYDDCAECLAAGEPPCSITTEANYDIVLNEAATIVPETGFDVDLTASPWDGSLAGNGSSWDASGGGTWRFPSNDVGIEGGFTVTASSNADGLGHCGWIAVGRAVETSSGTIQDCFRAYSLSGSLIENSSGWVITMGSAPSGFSFSVV